MLGASGYLVRRREPVGECAARRELAVLGLVGYAPGWLTCFPLAQSGVIALAGSALAIVFCSRRCGDQPLLLAQHSDRRERVMGSLELALCVLATVAVSLVPATITGLFYGRLEVSEELRDV